MTNEVKIEIVDYKHKHASSITVSKSMSVNDARETASHILQLCNALQLADRLGLDAKDCDTEDEPKPVVKQVVPVKKANDDKPDMSPKHLLEQAESTVDMDRQEDYGDAVKSFGDIAKMWSVILDTEVKPEHVALCMIALKTARCKNGGFKYDSWLDIAGYAALGPSLVFQE